MDQFDGRMAGYGMNPECVVKDEKMCEQDMNYMRNCYPKRAKDLLNVLYETCDEMEYEGSCMLAQYPDKETIYRMVDTIYEQSKRMEHMSIKKEPFLFDNVELTPAQLEEKMEKDLLLVLLCDEMHRRRMRYQRRNQLFSTC